MSSYRLKNVIILILLFMNLAFLFLVLEQMHTRQKEKNALQQQVYALYENSGIRLDLGQLSENTDFYTLELQRDDAAEAAFVEDILGSTPTSEEQGGGTILYTGENGQARFRSSGSFELYVQNLPVEDPQNYCRQLCQRYNYVDLQSSQEEDGTLLYTATATGEGKTVYPCSITFAFQQGCLQQVYGYFLPQQGKVLDPCTATKASALVAFLNYCMTNGLVCNEVQDLSPGYMLLPSSTASLRLVPVWQLRTDVSSYYVDAKSHTILQGT